MLVWMYNVHISGDIYLCVGMRMYVWMYTVHINGDMYACVGMFECTNAWGMYVCVCCVKRWSIYVVRTVYIVCVQGIHCTKYIIIYVHYIVYRV